MGQQASVRGRDRSGACCTCTAQGKGDSEAAFDSQEGVAPFSALRYDQPLYPAQFGEVGVVTWNVAGVNNNPFEYWVTAEETVPQYTALMRAVEEVLTNPTACGPSNSNLDLPVKNVFTEEMWTNLKDRMHLLGWAHLEAVEKAWRADYGGRSIISGFLLDKELGKKRFVSMPDRFTNTIRVIPKKGLPAAPPLEPVYRPAVTNNYGGDLSSMETWWEDWQEFMFDRWLRIQTPQGPGVRRPCDMLEKIKPSKYPAVTAEEEKMSVPLQMLCQAIFDAILVYLMNTITPDGAWIAVKSVLVDRLFRRKHTSTAEILCNYKDTEVICLQETAATFGDHLHMSKFNKTHRVVVPARVNGKRDQNSIIMLSKTAFSEVTEVTHHIMSRFPKPGQTTAADGDVIAVSAKHVETGAWYCIISFHADTDGLITIPFLEAVHASRNDASSGLSGHKFLLALDANMYRDGDAQQLLDVKTFMAWVTSHGMTTCWGDNLEKEPCITTCHARTFLQPQFQKGIRYADRIDKSDRNPKDLVVFYKDQFNPVQRPHKDNSGKGYFLESTLLPTLVFPSDHGIVGTVLSTNLPGNR